MKNFFSSNKFELNSLGPEFYIPTKIRNINNTETNNLRFIQFNFLTTFTAQFSKHSLQQIISAIFFL